MIEELIGRFSPESFGEWCREKFDRFTADPHEAPNAGDFPKARIVGYVQSLPDSDINRPLLVMSVYAGEQISERSSRRRQFDFARKQLLAAIDKPPAKVKGLFTQGLFAFHDKAGNFRLSLVSARADGKRLVYSDFKRQSFFVRTGQNNKTFRARMETAFGSFGDLGKAFSVETLTKEFYDRLFAWYERAMDPKSGVSFPNDVNRDDDDRTQLAEHLIRLITRLMFIWFIRQKNLIPDKIFEPAALKTLLKSFDPASPNQDNYYRAILQNLFFATLNCEIKERAFANESEGPERKEHFGIKLLYRYSKEFACTPEKVIELFRGVPFLNGGLFECLDKKADYQDGFSRNPKRVAHIPNNLFFDEHGLITLFARYDFTVDENDPNDSDVALDPELLGKVFENLLGAYNPETRETARKQSGSFYTPREIVNYMVDESLKAYLAEKVGQAFLPAAQPEEGGAGIPACHPAPTFVSPPLDSHLNISRRRLPHWRLDGAIYWVCFRLADSIPLDKLRTWKAERTAWCQSNPEPWSEQQWQDYNHLFGERVEVWLDAGSGSRSLARSDVREAVAQCLLRFNGERLLVHAAVVMPTHVHILIEPLPRETAGRNACPAMAGRNASLAMAGKNACPTLPCHSLPELLNGIKGASARAANKILGTTGASFWMDEAYDHIVRNEKQYRHFLHYIRENPVKAALRTDEYWLYLPDAQSEAGIPACHSTAQPGMAAPQGGAGIPACHANASIDLLFAPGDLPLPFTDAERRALVTALYHCRILDPACGSGAFPMGLLLKMVHLLQRLDPKNSIWHEVVMAETEKALAEAESLGKEEKEHRRQRITESFDQSVNQPDYARKLYLIENCIFGVDIQPIAVQIAKLRAFITLVCDQEPDLADAARNYRMLPLPNLETKFVAANSLIGLSTDFAEGLKPGEGGSRLDDPELVRLRAELAEVRHQHFRARNSSDKNACRKRDRELRGKIKTRLVEIACKPDQEKIAFYRAEIEKLNAKRKAVEHEEWKDVVQSRPQQGNLFDSVPAPVQTVMRVDVNKEARDRLDDSIRRNTRAIEAEEGRAKNKSAFQKEADTLAAWDPYDQNASSPFFDPAWMFGFKGGFDLVIGNPPYISHDRIENNDVLQALYVTWSPFADIYCYFAEKGISLLRDAGTLTFITSNSYIKADYGLPMRKLLGADNTILALVNIEDSQIFESAIVNTAIVIVKKGDHSPLTQAIITNDSCETLSFTEYISQKSTMLPTERFSGPRWILASEQHLCLLDKIIAAGETLKGRGAKIRLGIATGSNDAFIIDGVKRATLVAKNRKNAKILKPILRGRDIKRYVYATSGMYIILAKNGVDVKNEYPDLFDHLDSFGKAFKSRGAKGQQWWNLRACDFYDDFKKEKIVWIELTDKARFALCKDEVYCINSAYFMLPPPNTDCRYLLTLLNSRTVEYFVKSYAETSGMGTMRWINNIVSDIPIPDVSPERQTQLIALVDRILTIKEADPAADTSDLEAEIDRLVYELYGLTNDEIAIVEGRGASGKKVGQAFLPAKSQTRMSAPPLKKKPRKSVMTEDPDLA